MSHPGIYLHVPFCKRKCEYCSFYSFTDYESIIPQYRKSVLRDIEEIRHLWEDSEELPDTLYIGGGTPSLLPYQEWKILMPQLMQKYPLQEITIEVNPGTVNEEKIEQYHSLGINRLSIGIQSMEADVLSFLGRIHSEEDAIECLKMAKKYFPNFSVDIIFAIPSFSNRHIENTTRFLVENYLPPHISCYGLSIEPGTPFFDKEMKTEEAQFEKEYLWIHDYLTSQGYIHYEVSNYALPGYFSRHNSKYWIREPYWGIGPSAHSFWQEKRFEYEDSEDFFCSSISQKLREASILTEEEIHLEKVMLAARTQEGIPSCLLKTPSKKIQNLIKEGLVEMKPDHVVLTPKGWMVMNSIILELL